MRQLALRLLNWDIFLLNWHFNLKTTMGRTALISFGSHLEKLEDSLSVDLGKYAYH